MKVVNIEESNMKLPITEQRALTGDCLRTGGPNWCHIGLLDNKQSTIIFNKYMSYRVITIHVNCVITQQVVPH